LQPVLSAFYQFRFGYGSAGTDIALSDREAIPSDATEDARIQRSGKKNR
jgi:hypothetical protein